MNFKVRWTSSGYTDVTVTDGDSTIALGLLDSNERAYLRGELQSALSELAETHVFARATEVRPVTQGNAK